VDARSQELCPTWSDISLKDDCFEPMDFRNQEIYLLLVIDSRGTLWKFVGRHESGFEHSAPAKVAILLSVSPAELFLTLRLSLETGL
jgi:hypothetical protein